MILISATGRDRPGIVSAISQKLLEANCNIEDATMTRLSGEFAMILVVAAPPNLNADALLERLASLRQSHGLKLNSNDFDSSQEGSTPFAAGADANTDARYVLSVYGPDRTGLVARVAGILAFNNANITDLQTRVMPGHLLYVMIFELELSPNSNLQNLQRELDEAARELNVELTLRALEEDAL